MKTLTNKRKVEILKAARIRVVTGTSICDAIQYELVGIFAPDGWRARTQRQFGLLKFKPEEVKTHDFWWPRDYEGQKHRLSVIDELIEQFSKP